MNVLRKTLLGLKKPLFDLLKREVVSILQLKGVDTVIFVAGIIFISTFSSLPFRVFK